MSRYIANAWVSYMKNLRWHGQVWKNRKKYGIQFTTLERSLQHSISKFFFVSTSIALHLFESVCFKIIKRNGKFGRIVKLSNAKAYIVLCLGVIKSKYFIHHLSIKFLAKAQSWVSNVQLKHHGVITKMQHRSERWKTARFALKVFFSTHWMPTFWNAIPYCNTFLLPDKCHELKRELRVLFKIWCHWKAE